ncbi:MAG: hypothetical protein IPQ24_03905 [Anaeromyxobacter sp.]|nr:hypothetical protein [Anaeromyxobacter sp.]
MAGGATTRTVAWAVTESPAALVTVRVKVVSSPMRGVGMATPLVTGPRPWSTAPAPPLKVAVREVAPPAVSGERAAAKEAMAGGATTSTVAWAVTESPAALVTVRVKVAVPARVPVGMATPLATGPRPWSTTPAPPLKVAVREVAPPAVSGERAAAKEAMAGGATTSTVAWAVTESPAALVTVRVKVVVPARVPVGMATPLVTGPRPWSTAPAPPLKVAVREVAPPAVSGERAAAKEAMAGGATRVTSRAPGAEVAPAELVAVQARWRTPGPPAVKVVEAPVVALRPPGKVPPVMVHSKVTPSWGGTDAAPAAPAVSRAGAVTTGTTGAATTTTRTVRSAVPPSPPTESVKVVSSASAPVPAGTPLSIGPTPGSTRPVPPANTAVRVVASPAVSGDRAAAKEEMLGAGATSAGPEAPQAASPASQARASRSAARRRGVPARGRIGTCRGWPSLRAAGMRVDLLRGGG